MTAVHSDADEIDLRLAGIITNASTGLRTLDADPSNVDGARETARRAIRDGNRASDVIARLRALFSKRGLTLESSDLSEATRELIAPTSSDLQRNRVILQLELAADLTHVIGDRVQLQQVILNLIRSVSDAMGGMSDRPRHLLVRSEREGSDAAMSDPLKRSIVSVVDDDESVRESLPDLLRQFGFSAQAFASAEEFLASGVAGATSCLVLDVAMPGMSGPALHEELKRRRLEVPIVYITAHADKGLRSRLLAQGAVECLFKPFSETALLDALDAALRSREA